MYALLKTNGFKDAVAATTTLTIVRYPRADCQAVEVLADDTHFWRGR